MLALFLALGRLLGAPGMLFARLAVLVVALGLVFVRLGRLRARF